MPPNAVFLATSGEEGDAGTEALVKTSASFGLTARPEFSANAFASASGKSRIRSSGGHGEHVGVLAALDPDAGQDLLRSDASPTSSAAAFATESCEMSSALFAAACHDGTPFVRADGTKSLAVAEYSLVWSSDQTSADPAARSAHSPMSHARRPSNRSAPRSSAVLRTLESHQKTLPPEPQRCRSPDPRSTNISTVRWSWLQHAGRERRCPVIYDPAGAMRARAELASGFSRGRVREPSNHRKTRCWILSPRSPGDNARLEGGSREPGDSRAGGPPSRRPRGRWVRFRGGIRGHSRAGTCPAADIPPVRFDERRSILALARLVAAELRSRRWRHRPDLPQFGRGVDRRYWCAA